MSYEETFSTSSDNSQNNSAKSLLQSATKNAAPTGEDHNFADDPMDLTDSMIDNNHAANKSSTGSIVQVVPVFTPSAQLAESGMDNRGNLASLSGRKSLAQRTVIDSNMTSSNMSMSSVVGGPPLGTPRNPAAPIGVSSPWSCSMEMTEPVHVQQNRLPNQEKNSIFPIRNSFKAAEQSDHGMELTEAIPVKIRPFSINQVNDNVGDMSMEMTEMVKKTELQSFRSRMSSSNKSASMEFTEVVHTQRKSTQFQNFHLSGTESLSGNGMELTEPLQEHFKRSDPSERLLASGKLNSVPQAHHVTPFPHGENRVHDYDKSLADTSGNNSLCDMEMTGVLSLSKYNKMVPNDDDDDMEFTQMLSVNGPKKPRLSNEPDEEPFHIISPLSTKVCDVQQPSHQHKASRQSIPASLGQDQSNMAVPLASNKDSVAAANQFDDDDTFALNFKNIKREDEPIELSFLKEFRDSPKIDKTEARVIPTQSFASTQNAEPLLLQLKTQ
ncbi:hypothetical protein GE061_012921 [Apolygus lucorum]|uniref:Uncharacterized protein n=1 Tax=Apolygus lucorum TaxID=248454 RepID=A0A8S9XV16_APOLU|nr:hypothetical protein GE061_012921 [Apolygus lucorum]